MQIGRNLLTKRDGQNVVPKIILSLAYIAADIPEDLIEFPV